MKKEPTLFNYKRILLCLTFILTFLVLGCNKAVRVTSDPVGADIFSEGRPLGKTPVSTSKNEIMPNWNMDGIIPTRAVIAARKAGYEEARMEVTEFDLPSEISFNLIPASIADYFENYLEQNPILNVVTVESKKPPAIQSSQNLDADSASLYSNGFILVAYSGFHAEAVAAESIKTQAQKVGAAIVLMQTKFAGVETEMHSVTGHTSGGVATSFSSGSVQSNQIGTANATVIGPGGTYRAYGSYSGFGSAYYNGSSFAIIPGRSYTAFVPFSKRQYDNQITFWRKRKPNAIGVYCDLLPEVIRQQLQRNTGAFVVGLENGAPAFLANILIGDVIIAIADDPINTVIDLEKASAKYHGRSVKVKFLRNGQSSEVLVAIPE